MAVEGGIDVLICSWWGRSGVSSFDTQGVDTDPALFRLAEEMEDYCLEEGGVEEGEPCPVSFAFHLEPYENRSIQTLKEDLAFLQSKYGHFRSLYRRRRASSSKEGEEQPLLPVYFVYDSYHIQADAWKRLLGTEDEAMSVRGSELDGVFFGLWLEDKHGRELVRSEFDGFLFKTQPSSSIITYSLIAEGIYTYFASNGFSYASTQARWSSLCDFVHRVANPLLCSPSVGPGYDDTKIRPWNKKNIMRATASSITM